MNDPVWIETIDGELVNLNKLSRIKTIIHNNCVEILGCWDSEATPAILTIVPTKEIAEKILKKISKLIKSNVKCIDMALLVTQASNETEE